MKVLVIGGTAFMGRAIVELDTALAEGVAWHRTQPRRPRDYAFEDRVLGRV